MTSAPLPDPATNSKPVMLIIGSTGVAGRHLIPTAIEAGFRVLGTSRRPDTCDFVCDLLDPKSVSAALDAAAPDVVVNLAGAASVSQSFRDPVATLQANAVGALQLLDAVRRAHS